jgi:hypothetical protein
MSDVISWDKAIGKKVKSVDDKDVGKVEAITTDYLQVKEGTISKNYYYIPKYYLTGYDGDNLWISLSKDEVKSRFERENAPELSEWTSNPDYMRRQEEVTRQYPNFNNSIPMYRPSSAATIQMPWDKIIGQKVKSSDKHDLGEVESVSPDYIELKEGMVSKKHYYVPKYYIQGFDGDHLYASLTKDEVKDRFERDSPPAPSEFQSGEYLERVHKVDAEHPQFIHGVPFMAKEPSTEIPVDYSGTTYNIPWDEIIHKNVRTSDNVELGYVERVGNEFIVVREGVANVHIFYIPKTYIRQYDGAQLWIDAPSGLVRSKFEKENEPTSEEIRTLAREAPRYRTTTKPVVPESTINAADPASSSAISSADEDASKVNVETSVDLDKVGTPAETS